MKNFGQLILYSFIMAIIAIILYRSLKSFLFEKIKANKWVILVISIILLFTSSLAVGFFKYQLVQGIILVLAMLFLFWFVDLLQGNNNYKKNKKKDIVIRPKAKPNRVKNK